MQSPAWKHAQLSAETPDFSRRSRVRDCLRICLFFPRRLKKGRASERTTDERQTSDRQISRRARHDTTGSPENERGTQKKKELRTVGHFSRLHFFYIRTTLPFDKEGFKPSIQPFFFSFHFLLQLFSCLFWLYDFGTL